MRNSDVQRMIENIEEGIKRNFEKDYEIGSLEEAQKFAENRRMDLEKIPVADSTSEKKFPNK
jgi:hypothetical protein